MGNSKLRGPVRAYKLENPGRGRRRGKGQGLPIDAESASAVSLGVTREVNLLPTRLANSLFAIVRYQGNALCTIRLECGTQALHPPRSGGFLVLIPTKTPVFLFHSSGRLSSSSRSPFHVWRTRFSFIAFFPNAFRFDIVQSRASLPTHRFIQNFCLNENLGLIQLSSNSIGT